MLKVLVASGPTLEPLDPVRFLSNRSTGTMGKYLAQAARVRGHKVSWVQCPRDAETARDLLNVLKRILPKYDVFFMSAAVCDVRPRNFSAGKIKKDRLRAISFVKNPDVIAALSRKKKKSQVFVGFGIESKNVLVSGRGKLKSKGLDAIVMQKVTDRVSPFGDKKIDAYWLTRDGRVRKFLNAGKKRLSRIFVREAERLARWPRS